MLSLECRKVQALMSLYIDDALSYNLKMLVYNHLQKCKICKKKYLDLKKTMQLIKANFNKSVKLSPQTPLFNILEYENFKENISAYFDGELSDIERGEFNDYLKENNFARKYFNSTIVIENKVRTFVKNNSPVLSTDLSKNVIARVRKDICKNLFLSQDFFILIFFIIFIFVIIFAFENYFLPNYIENYEKVKFIKIKEYVHNANFKKFLKSLV